VKAVREGEDSPACKFLFKGVCWKCCHEWMSEKWLTLRLSQNCCTVDMQSHRQHEVSRHLRPPKIIIIFATKLFTMLHTIFE